jgi:heat shock protein HtpX
MGNQFRTAILLGALTVLIMVIGQVLGGRQGMVIALIFAAGMNFFSYWYSDRIVLRMYRAEEIDARNSPKLYEIVKQLSQRAGLPMPRVYRIPQEAPNAFATGRNPEHAVVAVTDGLLKMMDKDELRGVLAHEMAHIKDRDILIGSIAATMAGAIMLLASMARWSAVFGGMRNDDEGGGGGIIGLIAMSVIAPLAAMVIQMAISRSREYLADRVGAGISQSPEGLARALEKLGSYSRRIPLAANPSTAHMFIVNPLSGRGLANLFSTHPPIEERVARLRGRKAAGGTAPEIAGDVGRAQGHAFWDRLSR